jgi:uncharacterized protein YidB (DUF937 family)
MGLLDVLNGMQNGPRGQREPSAGGGGMSPITMAVLGLLAYKALKHFGGQEGASPAGSGGTARPTSPPSGTPKVGSQPVGSSAGTPGGGRLGDMLKGAFGGLLAGGAAGNVLSGGLNDLVKQFQQSGQEDVIKSWVGPGSNKTIAPNQLAEALGSDRINALMAHSGMSREDLLDGLSQELPDVIDQLTPEGRVPTEQEAARMV